MKYAILSDVHANDTALGYVLADAYASGAEKVVSLGDVVGYGPSPAECIRRMRAVAAIALAGNHDDAVAGRMSAEDFIDLAADSVARHREALAKDDLGWLKSLSYVGRIEGALLSHGDLTEPEAFRYIDCEEAAAANFAATESPLVFVGHTHVPNIFLVGDSGAVHRLEPQDFTCEDGKRYIVNVGSVGYPRARGGECHSSYVLYDSTARTVVFRFLPFVVSSVLQRGRNPRRLKKRVLALAALAVALAAGSAAFLLAPKKTVVNRVENVTNVIVGEDPALVVARERITLPAGTASVRAGLVLERNSPPVLLRIVFRSATGDVLFTKQDTVKSSSRQSVAVPGGAISAEFQVSRLPDAGEPRIKAFNPR